MKGWVRVNVCLVWLKSDSVLECGVVLDGILVLIAALTAFGQYFWSGLYQTTSWHLNMVLSTFERGHEEDSPGV